MPTDTAPDNHVNETSTSSLRILMITIRADYGGGPEHVHLLMRGSDSSVTYFAACPMEEPYWKRFESCVGSDAMVELPHRAFTLEATMRVYRFIRKHNIQLIHAHGKGGAIYGRVLAIMTGRPCVYTPHGLHVGAYNPLGKAMYLLLERFLSLFTAKIISVSGREAQQMRDSGLPANKILKIDNGVMVPAQLGPLTARFNEDGTREILMITRYDYQKNTEAIIDIARALRDRERLKNFRFRLLGTGDDIGKIERLIKHNDFGKSIIIEGTVPSSFPYMQKAFLCVSTSRWEGMPYALLEAQANGVPVVASDVVGNADIIIDSQNGNLFQLGDADQAAKAILAFADDHEHWVHCAVKAHQLAKERYSAERVAGQTIACYRGVLRD